MLRPFRHVGPTAALTSWAGGLVAYGLTKYAWQLGDVLTVVTPVLVSALLFVGVGAAYRDAPPEADEIVDALATDHPPAPVRRS
ncbi:hypothetical protein GCM10025787_14380 [Saccharopolyspora rosea]|uniref:Uncharacterized protein n=2 Tax=Saccharopolyspora rosea TaxID=524884 RepID=A0ABW3FQM2_9PSEU